jgi:hypothetical protein
MLKYPAIGEIETADFAKSGVDEKGETKTQTQCRIITASLSSAAAQEKDLDTTRCRDL